MTPTKADERRAREIVRQPVGLSKMRSLIAAAIAQARADAPHSHGTATSTPEAVLPATCAAGEGERAPMTMRERLARVLCGDYDALPDSATYLHRKHNPDAHWLDKGEVVADVDAILAALADPTPAMITAGINAWTKSPMAVVTQFRAMLKAAGE